MNCIDTFAFLALFQPVLVVRVGRAVRIFLLYCVGIWLAE